MKKKTISLSDLKNTPEYKNMIFRAKREGFDLTLGIWKGPIFKHEWSWDIDTPTDDVLIREAMRSVWQAYNKLMDGERK